MRLPIFLLLWRSQGNEEALHFDEECRGSCETSWLQRRAFKSSADVAAHELNNASNSFCDSYTDGTCKYFGCKSSRGPTQCIQGQCRCQPGYCAVGSRCVLNVPQENMLQCPQRTGGTCSWFGYCWKYRGPTRCVSGECLCQPGSAFDSCHA